MVTRFRMGLGALACGLAGCWSPEVDRGALPLQVDGSFSAAGGESRPDRWWTTFGDAELDRLVEMALEENFDLAAAWSRLRAARAVAEREEAGLFPSIDAVASGRRTRPEREDAFGGGDELSLGLAADYEIDLWGRIRSSARAADYEAEATAADYRTAALTLSAEVARTWFQGAAASEQHRLLEEQLEASSKVLELIEARFRSGQTRSVDVLRQRQLVEATREQIYLSESRIQVLEHALAVLLGRQAQGSVDTRWGELPKLPELPLTGLPGELIQRRPDLLGAYFALRAADADLAAAIADRFPRLTLSGSIATEADDFDGLFEEWIRSVTADLVAPIFAGGRLAAEQRRSRAVLEERVAEYGQAALEAFREVEDALAQERKQAERRESLLEQTRFAEQAYEQLRVEYFNGVGDYIEVLAAQTELQQLQRDLLSSRLALLEFRIALYRALAGGFETEREREEEV